MINSPPDVRETFSKPAECSRSNEGNAEIMNMLVSIKKEMEEREKMWEQQQRIKEEFLEAEFKRREQRWEQLLKQRDEEWKEEMERRERALMQRLDSKINTFYNEQLKKDANLLTFLEKREEKMESSCHTPIPGPTRMADPNLVRGARLYTGTLYLLRVELVPMGIQTISIITKIIYIYKRTTTGVVSIKIYTHILSPIYIYKNCTFTFTNQSAGHTVMNPY